MKRVAIVSRHGHLLLVMLEGDLRQAQQDAADLVNTAPFPAGARFELVGEVKALTKPSGWERCFPREGKRSLSAQAGNELVRRGRRGSR